MRPSKNCSCSLTMLDSRPQSSLTMLYRVKYVFLQCTESFSLQGLVPRQAFGESPRNRAHGALLTASSV